MKNRPTKVVLKASVQDGDNEKIILTIDDLIEIKGLASRVGHASDDTHIYSELGILGTINFLYAIQEWAIKHNVILPIGLNLNHIIDETKEEDSDSTR